MKLWVSIIILMIFSCTPEQNIEENIPINQPHLLVDYLKNPQPQKRQIAAFYLGQTRDSNFTQVLTSSFENTDTAGIFAQSNATILEALGKTGNKEILDYLTDISTYKNTDTALHTGRMSAIYEFGLREITTESGTKVAIEYISDLTMPEKSRFYAAHYLGRVKNIHLENYAPRIHLALSRESNPYIKMALITAAGRTQDTLFVSPLIEIIQKENDPRIVVNALRALVNFDHHKISELLLENLNHSDWSVVWTAANLLLEKGMPSDAFSYYELAKSTEDIPIKIILLRATLKYLPAYSTITKENAQGQLLKLFQNSPEPHIRSNAILALAENPNSIDLFKEKGLKDSAALVRKTTMQILRVSNLLNEDYLNVKDPSLLYEAALGFSGENKKAKELGKIALSTLKLPENLEVAMTISSLTGDSVPLLEEYYYNQKSTNEYSLATIQTSKGNIKLELYQDIAPLSVSAFIGLIEKEFYNGLTFHRVVPNFVIQGGCPIGDGLGGPDFLLKTETGLIYYDQPGRVGLASAGSGTEGSQFFITHSPAPHLNGKYTIFGQVISGMEVVNSIREGDVIQKIILE